MKMRKENIWAVIIVCAAIIVPLLLPENTKAAVRGGYGAGYGVVDYAAYYAALYGTAKTDDKPSMPSAETLQQLAQLRELWGINEDGSVSDSSPMMDMVNSVIAENVRLQEESQAQLEQMMAETAKIQDANQEQIKQMMAENEKLQEENQKQVEQMMAQIQEMQNQMAELMNQMTAENQAQIQKQIEELMAQYNLMMEQMMNSIYTASK